jgi:hypothetical protein
MNQQVVIGRGALLESSTMVRCARRIIRGSVICRAITRGVRWLGATRVRFPMAIRSPRSHHHEDSAYELLQINLANSRLITALSLLFVGPFIAWPETRVRQLLAPILRLDVPARVMIVCWSLIATTVTHALLMAVLAQPTGMLGWSVRAAFVAICVLALRRPRAVAAAWTEWMARTPAAGGPHER